MRLRVLGCSGGSSPGRQLSGFLLDDVFAVDAGSLTTALELAEQKRVEAVAITHAHLDHSWTFPLFLANRYSPGSGTCQFYADAATVAAIRKHLFNNEIWPDLTESRFQGTQLLHQSVLADRETTTVLERYEMTSYPVAHTVPSSAFLIRRRGQSVLVCGDTTTTEEIWRVANAADDLRGIVLECSFPSDEEALAVLTGHLTPKMFAAELGKLTRDVPVFATHIKPEHRPQVVQELRELREPRIRILEDGQVLDL